MCVLVYGVFSYQKCFVNCLLSLRCQFEDEFRVTAFFIIVHLKESAQRKLHILFAISCHVGIINCKVLCKARHLDDHKLQVVCIEFYEIVDWWKDTHRWT